MCRIREGGAMVERFSPKCKKTTFLTKCSNLVIILSVSTAVVLIPEKMDVNNKPSG